MQVVSAITLRLAAYVSNRCVVIEPLRNEHTCVHATRLKELLGKGTFQCFHALLNSPNSSLIKSVHKPCDFRLRTAHDVSISIMRYVTREHSMAGFLLLLLCASSSSWKHLTHDWTLGEANLYSSLAKEIFTSQRACNQKKLWYAPSNFGMGSDIHVSFIGRVIL